MLIERLFRNRGGAFVPFGPADNPEAVYHFAPRFEDGPHVCEVDNPDHAERLLAITEGYREVHPDFAEKAPDPVPGQIDYSTMAGPDLITAFKARFGREPGGRMTRDTVIKRLKDADRIEPPAEEPPSPVAEAAPEEGAGPQE